MISRSLHDPGLGFVGVDDQEVGPAGLGLLGHEAPLHAGREARAAAPAQADALISSMIGSWPRVEQRLGIVPIAALARRLQVPRLKAVDVGEDAVLVGEHQRRPPHRVLANEIDDDQHDADRDREADQRERDFEHQPEQDERADDQRYRNDQGSCRASPLPPVIVVLGRPSPSAWSARPPGSSPGGRSCGRASASRRAPAPRGSRSCCRRSRSS